MAGTAAQNNGGLNRHRDVLTRPLERDDDDDFDSLLVY